MQTPQRLAHLLVDHRIKKTEIAEVLGIDSSGVSRRLFGQTPWTLSELKLVTEFLAQRLGRPLSWDDVLDPVGSEAQ